MVARREEVDVADRLPDRQPDFTLVVSFGPQSIRVQRQAGLETPPSCRIIPSRSRTASHSTILPSTTRKVIDEDQVKGLARRGECPDGGGEIAAVRAPDGVRAMQSGENSANAPSRSPTPNRSKNRSATARASAMPSILADADARRQLRRRSRERSAKPLGRPPSPSRKASRGCLPAGRLHARKPCMCREPLGHTPASFRRLADALAHAHVRLRRTVEGSHRGRGADYVGEEAEARASAADGERKCRCQCATVRGLGGRRAQAL
jgi:hypothetical protein